MIWNLLNRKSILAVVTATLLGGSVQPVNAVILLETGLDGTSVTGGNVLSNITYTTENGLSGPTQLTGNPLHNTASSVGFYAPDIQLNNSQWDVDIPLVVTGNDVVISDMVLRRQNFNVSGALNNSANKTFPIIATLTGSVSGQVDQVTVDGNPWPAFPTTETFTFGAAPTLTSGESWTLNLQYNDGTATNAGIYSSFDSFRIEGQIVENIVPEPASFSLCTISLLSLGFVGWRRRRR